MRFSLWVFCLAVLSFCCLTAGLSMMAVNTWKDLHPTYKVHHITYLKSGQADVCFAFDGREIVGTVDCDKVRHLLPKETR